MAHDRMMLRIVVEALRSQDFRMVLWHQQKGGKMASVGHSRVLAREILDDKSPADRICRPV